MPAIPTVALALALLAACAGCASPGARSVPALPAPIVLAPADDGAILGRAPCQVQTEPKAFANAVENYHQEDILKAGLAAELGAKPLASIFTQDENLRLAAAARAGRCERVTYRSSGLAITGFVLRPSAPGPHPVLIWLRGGNGDFGRIEPVTLLNLQWLADAGFIVVATQYRGADGGEGVDEFGGADVDDVLALLPLARSLPGADVSRLYLVGGSRGAMQGTLAIRKGLPVRAAAYRGGVFDLKESIAFRPALERNYARMMPGYAADREGTLERRSAVRWAGELRVPTLLLHGREDWRVRVQGAQAFDALLAQAGVERKMVIYEREEHQLALHRQEWLTEVVSWFRAHGAFDQR